MLKNPFVDAIEAMNNIEGIAYMANEKADNLSDKLKQQIDQVWIELNKLEERFAGSDVPVLERLKNIEDEITRIQGFVQATTSYIEYHGEKHRKDETEVWDTFSSHIAIHQELKDSILGLLNRVNVLEKSNQEAELPEVERRIGQQIDSLSLHVDEVLDTMTKRMNALENTCIAASIPNHDKGPKWMDQPTEAGWYFRYINNVFKIVEVKGTQNLHFSLGGYVYTIPDDAGVKWYGPIPKPAPPSK